MTVVQIPKQKNPQTLPSIRVLNPGKGLNNFSPPQLIDDHEWSDARNCQITESGCVSKADGYVAVGTGLANHPKGLGSITTSTVRQLLTVDGTNLVFLNGSTWSSIPGATFTNGAEVNMCQCRSVTFVWNGVDAGAAYDGATLSRPATTISARFSIFYNGYQFASGVDSQPNRVYRSSPLDASDFTNTSPTGSGQYSVYDGTTHPGATAFSGSDADYFDVNSGDGDRITGFSKFQDALIMFKERSIYQLTLDSNGVPTVSLVTAARGSVGHKAIDTVDNDVFFLSRTGVYVLGNEPNYFSAIRTNELSARIKPTINTVTPANLYRSACIFSDTTYHLSLASGGTTSNNIVATYDKNYLGWSYHNHIHANSWTEFIDSGNVKHLYYASDDEAQVYEVVSGTYAANGAAISAYIESKVYDANLFDIYKRWIDIRILFRQVVGTITIKIYTDDGSLLKTSTISSSTNIGGTMGTNELGMELLGGTGVASTGIVSTNNIPYSIKVNTKSRTLKIRIENNNVNETFSALGWVLSFIPYNHYAFNSAYKIY